MKDTLLDRSRRPFLTAQWRYLALLNFEIDPSVLLPLVPPGTELDDWQGRTFVSLVGFLFLNTRVLGLAVPFHRNFEEVNLRFYVRRFAPDGCRRGVVFVRELVPRAAVAFAARAFYGEKYLAVPMSHDIQFANGSSQLTNVAYNWVFNDRANDIQMRVHGAPQPVEVGSHAQFITEHYWGYSRTKTGETLEYRVEHAPWRVWSAADARCRCEAEQLYGSAFVDCLRSTPYSALVADGSDVTVFKGAPLPVVKG